MNGRARVRSGVAIGVVVAGSLALAVGGLALRSAPSATAELIGPDECRDHGIGGVALKVDQLAPGTTRHGAAGFAVTVTIRALDSDDPMVDGDQIGSEVADFAASAAVYGVVVKGGRSPGLYTYGGAGTLRGEGLHAPVNPANERFPDISHLTFCHVAVAPTPIPTEPTRTDRPTVTPPTRPGDPGRSNPVPSPAPGTSTPSPTKTPGTPAGSTMPADPSRSAAAIDTPGSQSPGEVDSGPGGDDGSGVTLLDGDGDGDVGRLTAGVLVVAGIVLGLGALLARRRGQHRA